MHTMRPCKREHSVIVSVNQNDEETCCEAGNTLTLGLYRCSNAMAFPK